MKNSELCVPVAALALPGDQDGKSTPPAMGDSVDFSGTGKVTRIEGDKAYIQPETINGQAIETAEAKKPKSLDDEESELRGNAEADEGKMY